MNPFSKKDMSEEDIKRRYITPAIEAKWDAESITMETQITDGQYNLKGNIVNRGSAKRADYLLYINANNPIAVVEAKDNKKGISYGLQQAMAYAKMLDVPFAYSSNGDGFAEHDFLTGKERILKLNEFPSRAELIARYKQGCGLNAEQETLINQPYYTSQTTYPPRYYQRIAVNRTLDAIAKGQNRILLVMATGTGKTYTAFQIVYRLLKSKLKRKILYLADRNILVDQSIQQDFAPLKSVIHKINVAKDDKTTITSHQVYFSLYQQLVGDNDEEHLSYFGEPVYTYRLKEGIEDGFLAPFKVINITTNIGDGWRPYKGQKDIFGNEIEDRIYNNSDYDYNIIIEDRIMQVAAEITNYLKSADRMAKTIVFCPTEDAAERMRQALVNLNSDITKDHDDYIVRITGSDEYGKSKLDYFISVSAKYPVIATTSKLLSTGADCKMTKLIVLDEMIGSMTEFKQIIGRGTRLRPKEGKTHFVVMDFRNVTRLFADPDWDGPIEIDESFTPKKPGAYPEHGVHKTVSVYDANGKLLRQESIVDYTKSNIIGEYASLDKFIRQWRANKEGKNAINKLLEKNGIDLEQLKADQNMADVDDFDFICHLAFDKKPLTRKERANNVKKRDFLNKYSGPAREILDALLDKYMNTGIQEIEGTEILKLDPFVKYGKPQIITNNYFGSKEAYLKAVQELENEIYTDEVG